MRNNVEGVYVEVTVPVFVPISANTGVDGTGALGASAATDAWVRATRKERRSFCVAWVRPRALHADRSEAMHGLPTAGAQQEGRALCRRAGRFPPFAPFINVLLLFRLLFNVPPPPGPPPAASHRAQQFTRSWSGDLGSRPFTDNSSFVASGMTENTGSSSSSRSSGGGRSPTIDPAHSHSAAHPSSRRPPSRPPNSFMLYRQVKQAELRSAHHAGTITTTALSGIIADMWNRESPAVRQYYSDRALLLRQQHQINFPDTGRLGVGASRSTARRNSISTVSSIVPATTPGMSESELKIWRRRQGKAPKHERRVGSAHTCVCGALAPAAFVA